MIAFLLRNFFLVYLPALNKRNACLFLEVTLVTSKLKFVFHVVRFGCCLLLPQIKNATNITDFDVFPVTLICFANTSSWLGFL